MVRSMHTCWYQHDLHMSLTGKGEACTVSPFLSSYFFLSKEDLDMKFGIYFFGSEIACRRFSLDLDLDSFSTPQQGQKDW